MFKQQNFEVCKVVAMLSVCNQYFKLLNKNAEPAIRYDSALCMLAYIVILKKALAGDYL